MSSLSEGMLVIVGVGTGAFMLAFSRIVTAEAAHWLDRHRVQVEAMRIRNKYAASILALQPGDQQRGAASGPSAELGEVEILDESPRQAA